MKWVLGSAGLLAASVIFLGGGACGSPPPRAQAPPPKVSVAQPQTRQIAEYDDYNGWIDTPDKVDVRSRVRGHIVKVHFTDGGRIVESGAPAELFDRPQQERTRAFLSQIL